MELKIGPFLSSLFVQKAAAVWQWFHFLVGQVPAEKKTLLLKLHETITESVASRAKACASAPKQRLGVDVLQERQVVGSCGRRSRMSPPYATTLLYKRNFHK